MRWGWQQRLEMRPIEPGSRVLFAAGGNVFVAGNGAQGVMAAQLGAQLRELHILHGLEGLAFKAFEFDADGEVVAVGSATPLRGAGMPSPGPCGRKLLHMAAAANHKMARHLEPANLLEIRVGVEIELVGKELFDFGAAVLAGRQADGVHHHQVDDCIVRPLAHIG